MQGGECQKLILSATWGTTAFDPKRRPTPVGIAAMVAEGVWDAVPRKLVFDRMTPSAILAIVHPIPP